jgi:hypothetical protein
MRLSFGGKTPLALPARFLDFDATFTTSPRSDTLGLLLTTVLSCPLEENTILQEGN